MQELRTFCGRVKRLYERSSREAREKTEGEGTKGLRVQTKHLWPFALKAFQSHKKHEKYSSSLHWTIKTPIEKQSRSNKSNSNDNRSLMQTTVNVFYGDEARFLFSTSQAATQGGNEIE